MKKWLAILCVCLPVGAVASTIMGNPNPTVWVVDGSDVYVHSLRLYPCAGGSQVVPVDATLDAWEGVDVTLPTGSYCDVAVRLRWDPSGTLEPVSVGGFDLLTVHGSGSDFDIELDEGAGTAWIP